MTGFVPADQREKLWVSMRVFFCTPQTLVNDIKNGLCPAAKIVCLVLDEAHRATQNYAYTIAVELISAHTTQFRILALSATPGTNAKDIQKVMEGVLSTHPKHVF